MIGPDGIDPGGPHPGEVRAHDARDGERLAVGPRGEGAVCHPLHTEAPAPPGEELAGDANPSLGPRLRAGTLSGCEADAEHFDPPCLEVTGCAAGPSGP